MTSNAWSSPAVTVGVGRLAKLVQSIERRNLAELFEIHRQNSEFRRLERTMSINAFLKVSRFASLCDKWEQQGNLSSISPKKAFRRWMVRTNYEFGQDCIDRILASCRKTPKNVPMMFKIIVRKQTTLKKRKFLQFVSFLAEKLESSRQKILHNNKNFFFFSVCLIAGKKKNEELSRVHNSFVHLLNFRLGQNGGRMVDAVLKNSPKALLLHSLSKVASKKAFDALQSLRVFTKKTNFITSFKFVDLIQSRILQNFRGVVEDNQSIKRRFLELTVSKVNAGLRRILRQLANRSMMLRNQRLGMERFANLIERSYETARLRMAWERIHSVFRWKEGLKVLEARLPVFQKLVECEQKAAAMRSLAQYASRIQESRKMGLVKALVAKQKRRVKAALSILVAYNRKYKEAVALVARGLRRIDHYRMSLALERLVQNRLAAGSATKERREVQAHLLLGERLATVAKLKKLRALKTLHRFGLAQKRSQGLLLNKMKALVARELQKYLQALVENSREAAQREQKFRLLFKRQLAAKYREALAFGFARLRSLKGEQTKLEDLGRFVSRLLAKKGREGVREGLYLLKENLVSGRIQEINDKRDQQKWASVFQTLQRRSRDKQQSVLSRLAGHRRAFLQLSRSLFAKLAKTAEFLLHVYFKRLQKNKDMFVYSSDQEKRKIRNFRIANALLRLEEAPKRHFLEALRAIWEQKGHQDFVLKRTFQKMSRRLLDYWFSRLLGCVRNEKMQEIDKILAQTRNDLSNLHRQVLPQLNKMLIKNVFVALPTQMMARDLKIAVDSLRRHARETKAEAQKLNKLNFLFERNAKKVALGELRSHAKEVGQFRVQATFRAYCLEVLMRGIRKRNLRVGMEVLGQELEECKKREKVAARIVSRIRNAPLRSALDRLRQHAAVDRQQERLSDAARVQRMAFEGLRDLELGKKRRYGLQLVQGLEWIDKKRRAVKGTLEKADRRFVAEAYQELKENTRESKAALEKSLALAKNQRRILQKLVGTTEEKLREVFRSLGKQLRSHNYLSRLSDLVRRYFETHKLQFRDALTALKHRKHRILEAKRRLAKSLGMVAKGGRATLRGTFHRLRNANKKLKTTTRFICLKMVEKSLQTQRFAFSKLLGLSARVALERTRRIRNTLSALEKLRVIQNRIVRSAWESLRGRRAGANPRVTLQKILALAEKRMLREAIGLFRIHKALVRKVDRIFQKLDTKSSQKIRISLFSMQMNVRQKRQYNDQKVKVAAKMDQFLSKRWKSEALRALRVHRNKLARAQASFLRVKRALTLKSASTLASLRDFKAEVKDRFESFAQFMASLFLKKRRLALREALTLLKSKTNRRKFGVLLTNLHNLARKTTSKLAVTFSRLKRPDFRKRQVERGLFHLSNRLAIHQWDCKSKALLSLRRLSPIAQLKTFRSLMVFLTKAAQRNLLLGFLVIQSANLRGKKLKPMRPKKLQAIRFLRNFVTARNTADPQQLKYPVFLKLVRLLAHPHLSPAQELNIERLEQFLIPKRPENFEVKAQKLAETKFETIEIKSKNTAIQFGNDLLLEKNKLLMSENDSLEAKARQLKAERLELDKAIKGLQKESTNYETEIQNLQQECERLKGEREQLKNEQRMVEERLLAMDPNFDLNASRLRASILYNSVDNLQASQLLINKAARERKDLEALVAKYQEETRILEEEVLKLEQEELDILAKVIAMKKEKEEMQKKLKAKDDLAEAMAAENDALKRESQNAMRLLEEAKKAQAVLMEAAAKSKAAPAKDAGVLPQLEAQKAALVDEIGSQSTWIDTAQRKIDQIRTFLSERLPSNGSVETVSQSLQAETQELEGRQHRISETKTQLFEKLKEPKKELTNLLADKNYLHTQLKNHQQNKAKYEKELADPALSGKNRQVTIEKVNQMQINIRVIEDNIAVNEKNLEAETAKIRQVEAQIQAQDAEAAQVDQAIEAKKAEIREIRVAGSSLLQLTAEKQAAESALEAKAAELTQVEIKIGEARMEAEASTQADPETEKALARNRQQIVRLENLIQNNQKQIAENESKTQEVATEQQELKELIEEKEKKVLEIDSLVGGLAQKKVAVQGQIAALEDRKTKEIGTLGPDGTPAEFSEAPDFHKGLKRTFVPAGSSEFRNSLLDTDLEKLYQPSDFVPNDYSQILKSETGPSVRKKLTSRLAEIRANLQEYGKDIDAKDENIKAIRQRLVGNQNELTNFNQIFGQKVDQEAAVEDKIERNESIIEENKRLFAENAQKIQQNKEAIEKNYEEIKEINEEFKKFASLPAQESFLAAGRPRDVVSKKVQTISKNHYDTRIQTDLDAGDIDTLEKRARQKHIVKVKETLPEKPPSRSAAVDQSISKTEMGAQSKPKDHINFTQTQTYNASFKIGRDLTMVDNKLFENPKTDAADTPGPGSVISSPKNKGDFGKKNFVEQAMSTERHLVNVDELPREVYPGDLKPDRKDALSFVKRNPPVDPNIWQEVELLQSNRLKHLVRAEPRRRTGSTENLLADFNSVNNDDPKDNTDEVSFGNFESERRWDQRRGDLKSVGHEIDNIFEFLIPKSGPQGEVSPSISKSQKISLKFADHSRHTNIKKLTQILKIDQIIRNRNTLQVCQAFADLQVHHQSLLRADDRLRFELAKTGSFNNKKSRIQFQLKALKEHKASRNRQFCSTLQHIFDQKLTSYYFHFCSGVRVLGEKTALATNFKRELDIATTGHTRQMVSIRRAKGTFDGVLSRTIFRRLNQAFHRIFDYSQKRNQNFFKKFVPVIVRADENLKNLLMDVLQYWYNVRGESNWTQRIIQHFVFRASLTNQIAMLRLKMFKKKPPKTLGAGRELSQKLSVAFTKHGQRCLAEAWKLMEALPKRKPRRKASFNLSEASAEIEALRGGDEDSEREEMLKKYELVMSQQELKVISLNTKVLNARIVDALHRHLQVGLRAIMYHKAR